jgi:hypothetical protein
MIDIHTFVKEYNFCLDGGGAYTPIAHERAMLEDAINCYVAECEMAADDIDDNRGLPGIAFTDGRTTDEAHLWSDNAALLQTVVELKALLQEAVTFYDNLDRLHDPGEAALLDKLAAACR